MSDEPRERIEFKNAYFIKLGWKGAWEESSLAQGLMRIGWQQLDDINAGRWDAIKDQLARDNPRKGAATRDFRALRRICDSTPDDVWITFSKSKLWWARVGSPVILRDQVSPYRELRGTWSDRDVSGTVLSTAEIPGNISKIQGYRGTVCEVGPKETLRRLLNNEPSPEQQEIDSARVGLARSVEKGMKRLHWKDFETLVDLTFRQSGWRRLSVLGETLKGVDLELEDPITRDRYQVQIKSRASRSVFENCAEGFGGPPIKRLYFVVHTPSTDLLSLGERTKFPNVELIMPERLSEMVVNLGLVEWLMDRIR